MKLRIPGRPHDEIKLGDETLYYVEVIEGEMLLPDAIEGATLLTNELEPEPIPSIAGGQAGKRRFILCHSIRHSYTFLAVVEEKRAGNWSYRPQYGANSNYDESQTLGLKVQFFTLTEIQRDQRLLSKCSGSL